MKCLIIAHGPSWLKELDKAKDFDGIIIACDVCTPETLEAGIIPDYIVTLESAKTNVLGKFFPIEQLTKHKDDIKVIGSPMTRGDIEDIIVSTGMEFERFTFDEASHCSNVGIFAINYARHELKADNVVLLGFDHCGTGGVGNVDDMVENNHINYRTWQTDFWYFVKKWEPFYVINCTNGGVLYNDDLIRTADLSDFSK